MTYFHIMEALVKRLHTQFCRFQQEAKTVEDRVKAHG